MTQISEKNDLSSTLRPGEVRGLEFLNLDELRKRTGVPSDGMLVYSVSEMLSNALDTDATEIVVHLKVLDGFHCLKIRDNGTKLIGATDVKRILDFSNQASSKRGCFMVSRGSHGNALKCIFGASYALTEIAGLAPIPIKVGSHGHVYIAQLKPNKLSGTIESYLRSVEETDEGYNTFEIGFPIDSQHATYEELANLLQATTMVNPRRLIRYDLWGKTGRARWLVPKLVPNGLKWF